MREDDELRPAFSERRRTEEPDLTAEDSCAVFEAFRRWREHYPAVRARDSWWLRLQRPVAAGGLVLAIAGVLIAPRYGALWIAAAAVPLVVILRRAIMTMQRSALMCLQRGPGRPTPLQRQLLMDLWLAGATGRDIAEASFLEMRQRAGSTAMMPGLALTAGVAIVGWTGAWPGWGPMIGCLAALLLASAIGAPGLRESMRRMQIVMLDVALEALPMPPHPLTEFRIMQMALQRLFFPMFLTSLLLTPPLVGATMAGFARRMPGGVPWEIQMLQSWWVVGVPVWFAVIALAARAAAPGLQRRNAARLAALLDAAEVRFETFFRARLMEDPDA